ncbi:MAG: hypothetical protein V4529_16645 [Gemmatimonadota bacterium]
MSAANITEAEWHNHLELEGRVLGEYHRLAKATVALTEQTAKLTEEVRQLNRKQRQTDRAFASWNDLADEAKEAKVRQLERENQRLRSLPRRLLKWAGLVLGVIAVGLEVAHRSGLLH